MKNILLSKSRLMRGLQCEKQLYLALSRPELAPPVDLGTQARFDEGRAVGELARGRFPGGVLIDAAPWEAERAAASTADAIAAGALTIYEATFVAGGFTVRVDILTRVAVGAPWRLIEVKSSTSVKDEHIVDVAIQRLVCFAASIDIFKCELMFINSECVAPRLDDLFLLVDVTRRVREVEPSVGKEIMRLEKMVEKAGEPARDIGPHCTAPYECAFIDHCWKKIPTPSVFDIPRLRKQVWELYAAGKINLDSVDASELNDKQDRALQVLKTGVRFVDAAGISSQICGWKWPMYFLDFETVNPAIPLWDGTHPYEQVPFQFSCHILRSPGSQVEHFEYLHRDASDPRLMLAQALVNGIGEPGSVVAYNKKFEEGILRRLAEIFPALATRLNSIADRLVDPWPVLEENVYDKGFLSSYSLKSVAPALLGEQFDYSKLEIGGGIDASLAFLTLMKGSGSEDDKRRLTEAMIEYCSRDTLATVELLKWMLANSNS